MDVKQLTQTVADTEGQPAKFKAMLSEVARVIRNYKSDPIALEKFAKDLEGEHSGLSGAVFDSPQKTREIRMEPGPGGKAELQSGSGGRDGVTGGEPAKK